MAKTATERKREQRARERAAKSLAPALQQPVRCEVCGTEVVGRLGQLWCTPRCRQRAKRLGREQLSKELVQCKVAWLERARLGVDALRPEQVTQAQRWDRYLADSWKREQLNAEAELEAARLLQLHGLSVERWQAKQGAELSGCALWGAVKAWLVREGLWEEEEA